MLLLGREKGAVPTAIGAEKAEIMKRKGKF